MDQKRLTPASKINATQFYKHPHLDIEIATNPVVAIQDLWQIWLKRVKDQQSAAEVLTVLIDRGRKSGLQTLVYVESVDYLPEDHRLTSAVLSLQMHDQVYSTPPVNLSNYSPEKLFRLFELGN